MLVFEERLPDHGPCEGTFATHTVASDILVTIKHACRAALAKPSRTAFRRFQLARKERSERFRCGRYLDDRRIKGSTNMNFDISETARTDFTRIASQDHAPSGQIAFATGASALGIVLVARNAKGVCAVLIGSEAGALTADLAARFPQNGIARDDRKLGDDLGKILAFIDTPSRGLDLDLDVHGTPFQRRVWDALCAIPTGRTVTYAALARRIGEPG